MVYLIILLTIIIITMLPDVQCRFYFRTDSIVFQKKSFIEILFIIELLTITVLRKYTVGSDLRMYTRIFESINKYTWQNIIDSKFELGYMVFTKFIRYFTSNIQIFIAITGLLTIGVYIYEIVHKSRDPFLVMYLALTFGFFFFQFSMLRQAIAMSLVMLAINKLSQKKWLEYLIIVLIAASFHVSALVCLPLAFIVIFPWTDHFLHLIWVIEIAILIMLRGILEIIIYYIPRYAYILNEKANFQLGYIARIIIICGLYLLSIFFCKVGRKGYKIFIKRDDNKQDNLILILGSVGMMLMPMINYFESAQRMTYYFIPYVFWCVDLAVHRSRRMKQMLPIIYVLFGIYYIFCFTGLSSVNDAFGTNDYLFFWQ